MFYNYKLPPDLLINFFLILRESLMCPFWAQTYDVAENDSKLLFFQHPHSQPCTTNHTCFYMVLALCGTQDGSHRPPTLQASTLLTELHPHTHNFIFSTKILIKIIAESHTLASNNPEGAFIYCSNSSSGTTL